LLSQGVLESNIDVLIYKDKLKKIQSFPFSASDLGGTRQ
jgi:hypothetical protein